MNPAIPDNRPSPLGRFAGVSGGLLGFLGVAFGAFGAHLLEPLLVETGRVDTWETATVYHLVHALALVVVAGLPAGRAIHPASWLFCAGILIFSGSLYLLCLTGVTWLGAVTPLGGLCLLGGWLCLILAFLRQ